MEVRKRSCQSLSTILAGGLMPDDIIIDILSRLEVKSVLRCRCVCKSWKLITHQKSFIDEHQKRQLNKCPQIVHQYDRYYRLKGMLYHYQHCCNGLVLEINGDTQECRIRNPATRQVVQVAEDKSLVSQKCKFILGFDSSTGNYKVITFCMNKGRLGGDLSIVMSTIGSDDVDWSHRCLDITLLCGSNRTLRVVCHKDICYALTYSLVKFEKSDLVVVTMDGKSSMNINLPHGFLTVRRFHMFIVDDDKLSIGFMYGKDLHVWVLENYNKHIWSDKIIIPLDFMKDFPGPSVFNIHNSPSLGQLRFTIGSHFIEYDVHSRKYTIFLAKIDSRLSPVENYQFPGLVSLKGMRAEEG